MMGSRHALQPNGGLEAGKLPCKTNEGVRRAMVSGQDIPGDLQVRAVRVKPHVWRKARSACIAAKREARGERSAEKRHR
jgi:hypothetical protein